ncbi:type IX secretion system anionic LPS delivery protein PorZ [Larkinella soli]|uniref:type IX secretion system anionic LPS delivery protein PorZ n=1 Tax=Larkinella soli TaxID=1770527 RepID=UPI000FFC5F1B|nr:two-component regulator propeller domain-containing protein [Larkinella soli]
MNSVAGSLLFLLLSIPGLAQIGTWRTHPSFRSAQTVAAVQNRIYCASENGFFSFDPQAGEATRLTRDDHFSETGVSRLFYFPDRRQLLIGYRSGTLDVLSVTATGEPAGIRTITLIRDAAQIQGSRRINHVNRREDRAYLATDFGIVVLDVARTEILDTYRNLGPGGASVTVYATAFANDSLYAATSRGLLAARFAPSVNLAFFGNWRPVGLPRGGDIRTVVGVNNRLYAAAPSQGVVERQGGSWMLVQALPTITGLVQTPTEWVAAAPDELRRASGLLLQNAVVGNPREIVEAAGSFWIADSLSGLLRVSNAGVQSVSPDGPASDLFQRLRAFGTSAESHQVIALPGGFTDNRTALGRRRGFDLFQNGRWQNVLDRSLPTDFVAATIDPTDQRLFLGSFGGGIWTLDGQNSPEVVNRVLAGVSDLAADGNGDLWITTPTSRFGPPALYVRRKNGQIQSFSTDRPDLLRLVIDDNGFLWMALSGANGGGLLVFDPVTSRSRFLYDQSGEGNLPDRNVRSLVRDRDGLIWVGTDNGVAVFDNPAAVFTASVNAYQPVAGGRRLLSGESVTAITVDGGNRKWLGTLNGLFLTSADGTTLLESFTTDNSPLPDNRINDVAVDPVSGEVFVSAGVPGGSYGLVSYGGGATEPAGQLSGITIFPNPVRPGFGGNVGIRGLVENTVVKIMDTAGQLVYETRSQGGTATWNLRDYRGRAAETGIYFIFAVSPDGREGLAGKLAVVR